MLFLQWFRAESGSSRRDSGRQRERAHFSFFLTSNPQLPGGRRATNPIAPAAGTRRLSQRLERRAQLRREECRFFPGCEVSAAVDLVEVGETGVDRFGPTAWGGPDLARERGEADRNLDRRRSPTSRTGCGQKLTELPVPAGGRS